MPIIRQFIKIMTYRFWLVFGLTHLFFSSVTTPVAAIETGRLKCWSNLDTLEEVHKAIKKAEYDTEERNAFKLLTNAKDVEEICPFDSHICMNFVVDIQTRRQPFRMYIKGCSKFNAHKGLCEDYLRKWDSRHEEKVDSWKCSVSAASYCLANLCNTSNVGLIVGVIIAVIIVLVVLACIFNKRRNKNNNSSNNNNDNNNNNNNNNKGSGAILKQSKDERKSDKRSKSRSKSQEYHRVAEEDDNFVNDSLEEVVTP